MTKGMEKFSDFWEIKEGKVDLQIMEMLKNNLEECYKKATVKYSLYNIK